MYVTPEAIQPGDSFRVRFRAKDFVLDYSDVTWSGAFEGSERVVHNCQQDVLADFYSVVPREVKLDTTLTVTVTTYDWFGNNVTKDIAGTWVADSTAPTLAGTRMIDPFWEPNGSTLLRPNDTVSISITATDNHRLAWVGFQVPGTADSVAVDGPSMSRRFTLTLSSNPPNTAPVGAFAIDSVGNRGDFGYGHFLVDYRRRPEQLLPFPNLNDVKGAIYDPIRETVYISAGRAIQPLDLATGQYGEVVDFGEPIYFLELVPSGDSLLVGLLYSSEVAVLDVTTDPITVTQKTLDGMFSTQPRLMGIAATANGKVFVTASNGTGGKIIEYDLTKDTLLVRTDVGPISGNEGRLETSGDRSRMLLVSPDPPTASIYDAGTDTFGPFVLVETPWEPYPDAAVNYTGDKFVIGPAVFDAALNPIVDLWHVPFNDRDPDLNSYGSFQIDPVGWQAYVFTRWEGYNLVDLATGTVLERIALPAGSSRYLAIPERQEMLVWNRRREGGQYEWSLLLLDLSGAPHW